VEIQFHQTFADLKQEVNNLLPVVKICVCDVTVNVNKVTKLKQTLFVCLYL